VDRYEVRMRCDPIVIADHDEKTGVITQVMLPGQTHARIWDREDAGRILEYTTDEPLRIEKLHNRDVAGAIEGLEPVKIHIRFFA